MLLVATVMLTSASFAWFSISTKPEVTDIKASLSGNGNLEIALDGGKEELPPTLTGADARTSGTNEAWGNMIDLYKFFNPSKGGLIKIKPAELSINDGVISGYTPKFGLDGRVDNISDIVGLHVNDSTEEGAFKDFGGIVAWGTKSEGQYDYNEADRSQIYAFEIDFWVRTNYNKQASVPLTLVRDNGTRRDNATEGQTGWGSFISTKALTLALIDTDDNSVYYLVPDNQTNASGVYLLNIKDGPTMDNATKTISLEPNKGKLLKLLVYENGGSGDAITLDDQNFSMNVQFQLDGIELTSLTAPEEKNGRLGGT